MQRGESGAMYVSRTYVTELNAAPLHRISMWCLCSFAATWATQWYICRRDFVDQKLALHSFYERERDRAPEWKVPPPPAPPTGDGADAMQDVAAEAQRIVTYDRPVVVKGSTTSVPLR